MKRSAKDMIKKNKFYSFVIMKPFIFKNSLQIIKIGEDYFLVKKRGNKE
jgi:hypothetical protein